MQANDVVAYEAVRVRLRGARDASIAAHASDCVVAPTGAAVPAEHTLDDESVLAAVRAAVVLRNAFSFDVDTRIGACLGVPFGCDALDLTDWVWDPEIDVALGA